MSPTEGLLPFNYESLSLRVVLRDYLLFVLHQKVVSILNINVKYYPVWPLKELFF